VDDLIQKAATLQEALPYIRSFHGEIFVIKYGGNAMVDPALRDSFARDVVLMKYVGLHPVVVHGGGPQIDDMLKALGVVSERLDGLRVTDDHTMEVVEMVLGGKINQEIVSLIAGHGGRAVGLTGKDDAFLRGPSGHEGRQDEDQEREVGRPGPRRNGDAGQSGGSAPARRRRLHSGDRSGGGRRRREVAQCQRRYGKVAEALPARKFVLLTDIEGVRGKDGEVASSLSASEIDALKLDGVIEGGMIPKVDCALSALAGGVRKAHIIDGRVRHAVLLEIFTDEGIGTEITR
jgi:acetylglutamate kinase